MAEILGNGQSVATAEMRRLIWSTEAIEDLTSAAAYIEMVNPRAAAPIAKALLDAGEGLRLFPDRGRLLRPGVRELVTIKPYVIRYAVLPDEVRIVLVRHAARRPSD